MNKFQVLAHGKVIGAWATLQQATDDAMRRGGASSNISVRISDYDELPDDNMASYQGAAARLSAATITDWQEYLIYDATITQNRELHSYARIEGRKIWQEDYFDFVRVMGLKEHLVRIMIRGNLI